MQPVLALVSPVRSKHFQLPVQLTQRLILYRNELYRVPAGYRLLHIKAGTAYVTQAGKDHILGSGQEIQLDSATDMALVSALKGEQVILELFGAQN